MKKTFIALLELALKTFSLRDAVSSLLVVLTFICVAYTVTI